MQVDRILKFNYIPMIQFCEVGSYNAVTTGASRQSLVGLNLDASDKISLRVFHEIGRKVLVGRRILMCSYINITSNL